MKGDKSHIKVRFMGYTNSTVIKAKDGRNLLYKGEANIYKYDPILGQNKVVIGWDKYIEIPMNELPSNEIQVEGLGENMKIIYSNVVKFERGRMLWKVYITLTISRKIRSFSVLQFSDRRCRKSFESAMFNWFY